MDEQKTEPKKPHLGCTIAGCVIYSGCILIPIAAVALVLVLIAWRFLFGMDPPPSDRSLQARFASHREEFVQLRDSLLSEPQGAGEALSPEILDELGIERASVEDGSAEGDRSVRFTMRTNSILRFLFRAYRKDIVFRRTPPADPPPEGCRYVPLEEEGWYIRLGRGH